MIFKTVATKPAEGTESRDPRRNSLKILPAGLTKQARYCLLKLGEREEAEIWLIQDGDWLYVDLNGDGDLSTPEERFAEKEEQGFSIPEVTSRGYVIPPSLQSDPQIRAYFPLRISWQKTGAQMLWVRMLVEKKYWQEAIVPASATKAEFAPILHFDGPLRYFLLDPKSEIELSEEYPPSLAVAVGTVSTTGDVTYIDFNDGPLKEQRTAIPELKARYYATENSEASASSILNHGVQALPFFSRVVD